MNFGNMANFAGDITTGGMLSKARRLNQAIGGPRGALNMGRRAFVPSLGQGDNLRAMGQRLMNNPQGGGGSGGVFGGVIRAGERAAQNFQNLPYQGPSKNNIAGLLGRTGGMRPQTMDIQPTGVGRRGLAGALQGAEFGSNPGLNIDPSQMESLRRLMSRSMFG